VTVEEKSRYMRRNALKYLDKRISGGLKTAPKESGLYKVARAQKKLSPKTEVKLSKNIRIKMRAKVLQGKATLRVDNDFVDAEAIVKASGRANVILRKDIKAIGIVTKVDFDAQSGTWSTSLGKKFDENWSTVVSSNQDDRHMAFSNQADSRVEVQFTTPF
jgi:hypothetical protein